MKPANTKLPTPCRTVERASLASTDVDDDGGSGLRNGTIGRNAR